MASIVSDLNMITSSILNKNDNIKLNFINQKVRQTDINKFRETHYVQTGYLVWMDIL